MTALVVVALITAACTGTEPADTAQQTPDASTAMPTTPPPTTPSPTETETPTPTPASTSTSDGIQAWASCEHPDGITVDYPEAWHVNDGETLPPCSAFDPEPLDVPDAQEFFDAGVLLSVEPVDFSTAADPEAQMGAELNRRDELVDGHDAVRIETEAQDDALLAEGTRSTRWLVVLGREETLTLTTHEVGDEADYESNTRVLDEMVTRLELPDND